MKSVFLLSLLLFVSGCTQLSEAVLSGEQVASKTRNDVRDDLYRIAVKGQLGLLKAKLANYDARLTALTLQISTATADNQKQTLSQQRDDMLKERDAAVNQYAQTMVNMDWLDRQYEKANGLSNSTELYLRTQKGWLGQAFEDLEKARDEQLAAQKTAASQPSDE